MKSYPPKLFLCHSSIDREFVDQLATELHKRDIRIWYSKWEIKVGDSIIDRLNEGLAGTDYLVVVLSHASVISPWVREELNATTVRRIDDGGSHILPVLKESCNIPPLLSHLCYADFRHGWETGFNDLLAAIIPNKNELADSLTITFRQIERTIDDFCRKFDETGTFEELTLLDQLLITAVNMRCLYEHGNQARFLPREIHLFDELSFLESIGIKLRSSSWSLLRECRSKLFHSANPANGPVSITRFRKLCGGMSEIRRIARRICIVSLSNK